MASTYCTVAWCPMVALAPVPLMRSALSSWVGGGPLGTVTVGAVPAVPAGERSMEGMVPTATSAPPAMCVVLVEPEEPDALGAPPEPQEARPSVPPRPIRAARGQVRRGGAMTHDAIGSPRRADGT